MVGEHRDLFGDRELRELRQAIRGLPSPDYYGGGRAGYVDLDDDSVEAREETEAGVRVKVEAEVAPDVQEVVELGGDRSFSQRRREVRELYREREVQLKVASIRRRCSEELLAIEEEERRSKRHQTYRVPSQSKLVQRIKVELGGASGQLAAVKQERVSTEDTSTSPDSPHGGASDAEEPVLLITPPPTSRPTGSVVQISQGSSRLSDIPHSSFAAPLVPGIPSLSFMDSLSTSILGDASEGVATVGVRGGGLLGSVPHNRPLTAGSPFRAPARGSGRLVGRGGRGGGSSGGGRGGASPGGGRGGGSPVGGRDSDSSGGEQGSGPSVSGQGSGSPGDFGLTSAAGIPLKFSLIDLKKCSSGGSSQGSGLLHRTGSAGALHPSSPRGADGSPEVTPGGVRRLPGLGGQGGFGGRLPEGIAILPTAGFP